MGIGDLIRNTRPSLGIPKGTMGLVTSKYKSGTDDFYIYEIHWVGRRMKYSRRLARDLEVIG